MSLTSFISKLLISVIPLMFVPLSAYASEFQCSIKHVLRLNETGAFVTHEWATNYQNREFTVDRATGKVTGTTALKVRLGNFNQEYAPQLLTSDKSNDSYKAITLYEKTGQYALLQINGAGEGNPRPFLYHTYIDMILTGVCADKP